MNEVIAKEIEIQDTFDLQLYMRSELCKGCGLCVSACPEIFVLKDGVAMATMVSVPQRIEDRFFDAVEECPVMAICACDVRVEGNLYDIKENAGSVAGLLLTTEVAIAEILGKKAHGGKNFNEED